jgi:hypothetical protein
MSSQSVLLSCPGLSLAQTDGVCPAELAAGIQRSSVVAVVDKAGRQPRRLWAVRGQHAVSTHPVLSSGIRLSRRLVSSRPVSGHLGRRPGSGRPLSARPASSPPWCPPVRCPAGWYPPRPDASVWSHLRRWRWGPGQGGRGNRHHRNGAKSLWAAAPSSGSVDGRRGLGRRRCRARASGGAPVAATALWAREQAAARGGRTPRGCRPWAGWRPRCVVIAEAAAGVGGPGGADGRAGGGMGVRPQRGPGWQRALPARCRQRCDLRGRLVGLPGLEPGTSSLSGIEG